jgi:hypothetical protein
VRAARPSGSDLIIAISVSSANASLSLRLFTDWNTLAARGEEEEGEEERRRKERRTKERTKSRATQRRVRLTSRTAGLSVEQQTGTRPDGPHPP